MNGQPARIYMTDDLRNKWFGAQYWDLITAGHSHGEAEALLAKQGCPTDRELEAGFVAVFGMSCEEAHEQQHQLRCLQAEERNRGDY